MNKNEPEYYSELYKLINKNVVSEKTAQIHVGDFKRQNEESSEFSIRPKNEPRRSKKVKPIYLVLVCCLLGGYLYIFG